MNATQTYKTQDFRGTQQQVSLNCYSTRITNTGTVPVLINASLLLNVGDSIAYTADVGKVLLGELQVSTGAQGLPFQITVEQII